MNTPERCQRDLLTPEEIRAILARKGWTIKAIAERWEVSRQWLSKLIADRNRPIAWQDAVLGCPNRKDARDNPLRAWRRRLQGAAEAEVQPDDWGIDVGDILRLERDLSERAPEGTPATVVGRRGQGRASEYLVLLAGELHWIGRHDLDGGPRSWLHYSGQTDPHVAAYKYTSEEAARGDLARGALRQGVLE